VRAAGRLAGIGALAPLLAACVKVDMELEVSPENTVSGNAVLAVDQNLLELSGQSADQLFEDMDTSTLPPGASVEPYEDDGFVGQQITFDAVSLTEFSQGGSLGGTGEELSITREGDEFHVSGQLDMSGSEFGGGQVPQQFLDTFEFRIAITFPGPVESATGEISGNTVVWEPRIGQNTRIEAVASAIPSGSSMLTIVLIVAGLLILAAIAFLVLRRRAPAPAAAPAGEWGGQATGAVEPTAPAGPVMPGEAPAPPPAAPDATSPTGGPVAPPPAEPLGGGVPPEDEETPPPVPPVSG
jgi:hypothetical protein